MSNTFSTLTSKQLRRAATIRERIDKLEKQLAATLNVTPDAPVAVRKAGRARRAAAKPASPPSRPKRRYSKAARARMSAAAKKRWAAVKAAGKESL
jgi:hypothetical protein